MLQPIGLEKTGEILKKPTAEEFQKNELLIQDLIAIKTEKQFLLRWELVNMYWLLGERIRENYKEDVTKFTAGLAVKSKISERMLWYSVALYDKYPQADSIPEGKNITMNKLITKYLTAPKEEKKQRKMAPSIPVDQYNLVLEAIKFASERHPSLEKRQHFDTLYIEMSVMLNDEKDE